MVNMLDGYNQHIYNELLHYMIAKPFHSHFKDITKNNKTWCPFTHGQRIDNVCYSLNPSIETLILFLEKYRLCNQFLNTNRYYLDQFTKDANQLNFPDTIQTYKQFKSILSQIDYNIQTLDDELQPILKGITCKELQRLDEALINYSNHCLLSCSIMAISAVELRLHILIKKLDNKRYNEQFKQYTLGKIIGLFGEDGKYEDIKRLLPKKHYPLIQLLNEYRIFTVHPKDDEITPTIADSILSLSFTLITDPELSVNENKELFCQSPKPTN
jgi:hypothetical protein